MTEPVQPLARPVPLTSAHDVAAFDCGKPELNRFLTRFALQNQGGGSARTFVVTPVQSATVVGYYSLAPASVPIEMVPERVAKGQPRHPVPVVLMARFAIATTFQGRGVGRSLFFDALKRALDASEEIGGRAFFVEAKDDQAAAFYARFGMESAPSNPHQLFLLFKDARKTLGLG